MTFEDYILEHFRAERVSMNTQLLIHDECPFCGASGRLYVDRKKGVGICFKCSEGFGAVKFVAAHQGVSRTRARSILNEGEQGIKPLEDDTPEQVFSVWFPPTVTVDHSPDAVAYLSGRGIGQELVDRFGITYCHQNTMVGDRECWTKGRIIIPLFDAAGNAVGWQGRDITGRSRIKYLFMPGFNGAENVFNIGGVSEVDYLVVCEGVFDVFGWVKAGVTNTVGTFGKKISAQQVDILSALNPAVLFIAWDSDATMNKFEFVERHGHRFKQIRIVDLQGKDADELDRNALLTAISRASEYSWEAKILQAL